MNNIGDIYYIPALGKCKDSFLEIVGEDSNGILKTNIYVENQLINQGEFFVFIPGGWKPISDEFIRMNPDLKYPNHFRNKIMPLTDTERLQKNLETIESLLNYEIEEFKLLETEINTLKPKLQKEDLDIVEAQVSKIKKLLNRIELQIPGAEIIHKAIEDSKTNRSLVDKIFYSENNKSFHHIVDSVKGILADSYIITDSDTATILYDKMVIAYKELPQDWVEVTEDFYKNNSSISYPLRVRKLLAKRSGHSGYVEHFKKLYEVKKTGIKSPEISTKKIVSSEISYPENPVDGQRYVNTVTGFLYEYSKGNFSWEPQGLWFKKTQGLANPHYSIYSDSENRWIPLSLETFKFFDSAQIEYLLNYSEDSKTLMLWLFQCMDFSKVFPKNPRDEDVAYVYGVKFIYFSDGGWRHLSVNRSNSLDQWVVFNCKYALSQNDWDYFSHITKTRKYMKNPHIKSLVEDVANLYYEGLPTEKINPKFIGVQSNCEAYIPNEIFPIVTPDFSWGTVLTLLVGSTIVKSWGQRKILSDPQSKLLEESD